jgi:hypothetical protein
MVCAAQLIHQRAQVQRQVMGEGGKKDAIMRLLKDPRCQITGAAHANNRLSCASRTADQSRAFVVRPHNGALVGYPPQLQRGFRSAFEFLFGG